MSLSPVLAAGAAGPDESTWLAASPKQLVGIAKSLASGKTADKEALTRLATATATRFLPQAKAQRIPWKDWLELATLIGAAWPPEMAGALTGDLAAKLDGSITDTEIDKLLDRPDGVARLVRLLTQLGPPADSAWLPLATAVDQRFMADTVAMRKLPRSLWQTLCAGSGAKLTPEMKTRWLERLTTLALGQETPAGENAKAETPSPADYLLVRSAIRALDADAVAALDARCFSVTETTTPVSRWAPRDWAALAKALPMDQPESDPLIQRASQWLDRCKLGNDEQIRGWTAKDWRGSLGPWLQLGSDADRQRRAEALASGLSDPKQLAVMPVEDAKFFAGTLEKFSPPAAGQWAAAYLAAPHDFAKLDKPMLTRLARCLVVLPAEQSRPALERLHDALLNDPGMDWPEMVTMVITWVKAQDKPKAQAWVHRMDNHLLGTPDKIRSVEQGPLVELATMYEESGLEPVPGGHLAFAQALANLIRDGRDHVLRRGGYWRWGYMCADPASIAELRQVLLDGQGLPRPAVSKTLAWAYAYAGLRDEWQQHVQKQLDDFACTGDRKALWLVARAWTEAADPPYQNLMNGIPFLMDAASVATTKAVKMEAHSGLIDVYVHLGNREGAKERASKALAEYGNDEVVARQFRFILSQPD